MVQPGWVGRRVSVRTRAGIGANGREQYRDVVGDLLGLGDGRALVEAREGLVAVPLADVALARPAPPSTAEELALEAIAARGWRPDEESAMGGWVLRAAAGFTGRANSVLPLRPPGMSLDDAIAGARDWYAARGLPLRFQVPAEARRLLDAALGERGWPASPDVGVMAARLDALSLPDATDVRLGSSPSEAWLRRFRDGAGTSSVARRILTRHARAAFAAVERDDEVVAIGRGAVDEGWLGITAVEVAPGHRRAGLARAIVAALRDWAVERGATRAYLQVSAGNEAALALYEGAGFWHHHTYRYRDDPGI